MMKIDYHTSVVAVSLALACAADHLAGVSPPLTSGEEGPDVAWEAESARLLSERDAYLAPYLGSAACWAALAALATSPEHRAEARRVVARVYGEAAVVPVRAFGVGWREFGQVALDGGAS